MLDNSAGIYATAKVCLQLPERRRIVGCVKDSARFQDVFPSLEKGCAKQVFSADYNIAGGDEVVEAEKLFVNVTAALELKSRVTTWTLPPLFVSV